MKPIHSLAEGSDRKYYLARVRADGLKVKFQIQTSKLNRDYGATFVVDVTKMPSVIHAVQHKERHGLTVSSLYKGSNERYVLCQLRLPHGSNKIRVQMRLPQPMNREYGIAFDVYQIGLHASLKAHIATFDPMPSTFDQISNGMEWSLTKKEWVKKTD